MRILESGRIKKYVGITLAFSCAFVLHVNYTVSIMRCVAEFCMMLSESGKIRVADAKKEHFIDFGLGFFPVIPGDMSSAFST